MMYDFGLAWRSMRNRPVESLIPIFVVGFAMALSIAVIVLADGTEEGIVQASDPFGVLVVGPAGSGQQLVLSSILLQGNPIGNMPYAVYDQLENDERVRLAVPLAFGDSVSGARIIGTNHNFFELRRTQLSPPAFQLAEGQLFEDAHSEEEEHHDLEAVLGSDAARQLGLKIGDRFQGTHGVGQGIAENVHQDAYTVVGILQASGTAYDSAVYTPLEAVWDVHASEDEARLNPNAAVVAVADTGDIGSNQVTSVLVLPTGFIEQNQIVQEFYVEPTLQAAFPGEELGNLLSVLNQGQEILNTVGYLVLGVAGLTVFLSMYSAIIGRKQSVAIMRALGSRRITVFRVVIFETLLVSVIGSLVGRLLGYGAAFVIATVFSQQSAIPIPIRFILELEILLWTLSIALGFLAGIIPAYLAYRVDVVENLFAV